MSKKVNLKYVLPFIVFIVMAIFLGRGLSLNPRYLPSTLIDKPAPAFLLSALSNTDKSVAPTDYLGRRWILNVWASWCVGCRIEHPLLNQLAQKTAIPLIGLNYKDKSEDANIWLKERGNPYQAVAVDQNGDAGIDWGVYGVPETFVIDEKGNVIYKHAGPLNASIISNEILPLFDSTSNMATN